MSFAAAVDHLHALGQELAPSVPRRKFDLDHMRILARALGDPHRQFPAILIAGTNGKGSTAATLAAILVAAGYRTGLYTSPHLSRVTERIRTAEPRISNLEPRTAFSEIPDQAGAPHLASEMWDAAPPLITSFHEIPDEAFARLYFQVDDAARQLISAGQLPHHPSFFESLTALAFLYFAEQKLDIAILEVGLGGRLDATNIVEPILSIITDIALDHQDYLGNTITEIAREKAGILRPNGTLITLPQHPEANQAIGEAAVALNVHAISAAAYLPNRDALPTRGALPTRRALPNRADSITSVILSEARSAQSKDPRPHSTPLAPNPAFRSSSGLQPAVSHAEKKGALAPAAALSIPTPLVPNHYDVTLDNHLLHVRSPLPGQHQQRNIALAIAAAVELRYHPLPVVNLTLSEVKGKNPRILPTAPQNISSNQTSYKLPPSNLEPRTSYLIPNSAIEAGIANTSWPGRLEFLPPNLLLDVAHNPAGAWTLRAAIATLPEDQPRTLIFSCLRDKDLTEMAQILFPLFDAEVPPLLSSRSAAEGSASPSNPEPSTSNLHHLVLTPIDNPRAASLEDLLAAARALDIPAHPAHDPVEALALAQSLTPADGLIVATGSVYLIGAIRDLVLAQ